MLVLFIGFIAAILISPMNKYFLGNFLWFWLPQATIISLLFIIKVRSSIITGCTLIMTIHLIFYWFWISSSSDPSSTMAWIGYLFSIPGAFIGSFLFATLIKKYQFSNTIIIIGASVSTFIGIAIIQLGLCCTVLYCGFKCQYLI